MRALLISGVEGKSLGTALDLEEIDEKDDDRSDSELDGRSFIGE